MKESRIRPGNKWLVVLICVLLVAIVGLGLGVFLVNSNSGVGGGVYSENDDGGVQAMAISQYIEDGFRRGDYSWEDAIKKYDYEISFGDTKKRVYLAIDYANFVFEESKDIDMAVEIMERVEPLVDSLSMATDYYITLASLYEMVGYVEQAKFYNQKISEMTPKVDSNILQEWTEGNEIEE